MSEIGRGQIVSGGAFEGVLHEANTVDQVFALMKNESLEEVILLTDSPSATAVVPLLAKVRGIVCRTGGMTSHLAIVSREFGLPCMMGAEIDDGSDLEGAQVSVSADGAISRA